MFDDCQPILGCRVPPWNRNHYVRTAMLPTVPLAISSTAVPSSPSATQTHPGDDNDPNGTCASGCIASKMTRAQGDGETGPGCFGHFSRPQMWRLPVHHPSPPLPVPDSRQSVLTDTRAMKLSARNILHGKVLHVTRGAVNDEIVIEIAPGVQVTSIITHQSCVRLGLEPGKDAYAVIKASDVMVAIE